MVSAVLLQSVIWISLIATGEQYDITHIISRMCVVRQSTVLIPCKYTHPQHEQVSAVEWLHEKSPEKEVRVSQDPSFEGRVELQADAGNCSLLLRDVNESDAGLFRFVLSTGSGRNWTNAQGIRLEVTDAEVEVKTQSDNVTEGDWILFICGSCIPSMTVPTYIWRKDGHLHSQLHGDNMLDLESVGLEDRGRYSCTMSGHERLNSTSVNITVRPGYSPQSISVSISPSGEIVSGDSVTLNCITDAKPPAEISWFKEDETSAVGSGQSFSISSFSSSFSGRFYCEAQNKYGSQRSASVSLSVSFAGGRTAGLYAAAGIGAALICICIIVVVIKIISRKTGDTGVRGGVSKQENSSAAVTDQMSTSDSGVQNDVIYSSIDHKRPRKHQSAGDENELQYASVHHHRNTGNTSVKAEGPSGDVRDLCPADSVRSDDSSVIYSSFNVA